MRTSNRRPLAPAAGVLPTIVLAVAVAACGGSGATPEPTPVPTPAITPDPHLIEPASVDDVFRKLGSAGLRVIPNTADAGPNGEPVKRINATYADWPIVLTQYTTAVALVKVGKFDPKVPPRRGEAPFILAGMNILVEFGPHGSNSPVPESPDPARHKAVLDLIAALDPLLGPLRQRSSFPVPLPTRTPLPTASPAPVASAASPRPTK